MLLTSFPLPFIQNFIEKLGLYLVMTTCMFLHKSKIKICHEPSSLIHSRLLFSILNFALIDGKSWPKSIL